MGGGKSQKGGRHGTIGRTLAHDILIRQSQRYEESKKNMLKKKEYSVYERSNLDDFTMAATQGLESYIAMRGVTREVRGTDFNSQLYEFIHFPQIFDDSNFPIIPIPRRSFFFTEEQKLHISMLNRQRYLESRNASRKYFKRKNKKKVDMYMHGDLSRPYHGYYNKPPNPVNIYSKENLENNEDKGSVEGMTEPSENDSYWDGDLETSSNSENALSSSDRENDLEQESDKDNEETYNHKHYYVNKYLKFLRDESTNLDVSDFGSEELEKIEMKNFYMWRSLLSEVEAREKSVVTPYEKNIDFWRQLWRVIERSHLVLIILDSRDPLFFRIIDLENYIKEIDRSKEFMLVLNKADFLSKELRVKWARYFKSKNIDYVFFSSVFNRPNQSSQTNGFNNGEKEDEGEDLKDEEKEEEVEEMDEKEKENEKENEKNKDTEYHNGMDDDVQLNGSKLSSDFNDSSEEDGVEVESESQLERKRETEVERELEGEADGEEGKEIEDVEEYKEDSEYEEEKEKEKEDEFRVDEDEDEGLVEGLDKLDYKVFNVEMLLDKINKYKGKFYTNNPQYLNNNINVNEDSNSDSNSSSTNKTSTTTQNKGQEKKEKRSNRNRREKKRSHYYTVGFVGYPNVGKSSLINCLMESNKACVGVQPGKTKHMQTLFLKNSDIVLCDCPGLIFPTLVCTKYHLLINNIVSTSHFKGNMTLAVQLICNLIPLQLCRKYDIDINDCLVTSTSSSHSNLNNFNKDMNSLGSNSKEELDRPVLKGRKVLFSLKLLELLCRNRNYRSGGKGGQLDYTRASKLIINDFTQGALLYCKKPPLSDKELGYDGINSLDNLENLEDLDNLRNLENIRSIGKVKNVEKIASMEKLENLGSLENGDMGNNNLEMEFNKMYITNASSVSDAKFIGKTVTESKKDEENVNQWLKNQLNKNDNTVRVTKRKLRFLLKGKRKTGQ